jgi:hypothetical protein
MRKRAVQNAPNPSDSATAANSDALTIMLNWLLESTKGISMKQFLFAAVAAVTLAVPAHADTWELDGGAAYGTFDMIGNDPTTITNVDLHANGQWYSYYYTASFTNLPTVTYEGGTPGINADYEVMFGGYGTAPPNAGDIAELRFQLDQNADGGFGTVSFPGAAEYQQGLWPMVTGESFGWSSTSWAVADIVSLVPSSVPEPSTWALMLIGFACLAFLAHRRRRAAKLA